MEGGWGEGRKGERERSGEVDGEWGGGERRGSERVMRDWGGR